MNLINSKHPSETQLEQFVQFRDELSNDIIIAIDRHLTVCTSCSEMVKWFQNFYNGLFKTLSKEDISEKSNVVKLYPYKLNRKESLRAPIVLAATSASVQERFTRLATLYSEEEGLLVRILSDEKERKLDLYLHARNPLKEPAIVEFPKLGLEIVTDKNGRASFKHPAKLDYSEWANTKALVHIPFAKSAIQLEELVRRQKMRVKILSGKDEIAIELRLNSDQLMVHCLGDEALVKCTNYLLINSSEQPANMLLLEHGMGLTTAKNLVKGKRELILYH